MRCAMIPPFRALDKGWEDCWMFVAEKELPSKTQLKINYFANVPVSVR